MPDPEIGRDTQHAWEGLTAGCAWRKVAHLSQVCELQDAHCDGVPDIPLANGSLYRPGNCYIDMYNSICAAKHFIYICGKDLCAEAQSLKAQRRKGWKPHLQKSASRCTAATEDMWSYHRR